MGALEELNPVVKLYRNPWSAAIPHDVLGHILVTSALDMATRFQEMIAAGEVRPDQDSFGAVFLDPTRPRGVWYTADLVVATIEMGPSPAGFLPNGLSKGDGQDRHGMDMHEIVTQFPHLLHDGEFLWGHSVVYKNAPAGGSGLSAKQDGELVEIGLKWFIDSVISHLLAWIKQERAQGRGHWLTPDDTPGTDYAAISILDVIGLYAQD